MGGCVFFGRTVGRSDGRSDGRLQFFDTHTTSLKPATPAYAGFAGKIVKNMLMMCIYKIIYIYNKLKTLGLTKPFLFQLHRY